jgi:hypothetical protein
MGLTGYQTSRETADGLSPRDTNPRIILRSLTIPARGYGGDVDLVGSDWAPEVPRLAQQSEEIRPYGGDPDLL